MTEKIPNCRGSDPETFFDSSRWTAAAKICKDCPLLLECRTDYVGDRWAFAGGMRPAARRTWWQNTYGTAKPPSRVFAGNFIPLEEDVKGEIVRLFHEDKGQVWISKELGVSQSSVRRVLIANGLSRTPEERLELCRKNSKKWSTT